MIIGLMVLYVKIFEGFYHKGQNIRKNPFRQNFDPLRKHCKRNEQCFQTLILFIWRRLFKLLKETLHVLLYVPFRRNFHWNDIKICLFWILMVLRTLYLYLKKLNVGSKIYVESKHETIADNLQNLFELCMRMSGCYGNKLAIHIGIRFANTRADNSRYAKYLTIKIFIL